jgi:hypothetical protein
MNLTPKTAVLGAALAALALFAGAWMASMARLKGSIASWACRITLAQYVFLAWKEGFTRSGDWHAFIFLWFLPIGFTFLFVPELSGAPRAPGGRVAQVAFGMTLVLCLVAANRQIPGFVGRQAAGWPPRVLQNTGSIFAVLTGRSGKLYADCRDSRHAAMLQLDRAKDVIGDQSVDVMNYLTLAPVINGLNYRPRPVFQGFVAYTADLQRLNAAYFQSEGRPHFVMLCQQATDGRFPSLEDSAALNYVLNNYVPVAQDGPFLILQQRTAEVPEFKLVREQTLRFGEKLDLSPWAEAPLFMSVSIRPTLLGRAVSFVYQQQPLFMRVASGGSPVQYRIVPSMADQPFLVNPVLNGTFAVLGLYARMRQPATNSVVFERPAHGSFEFHHDLTVRLYTAPGFLHAARGIAADDLLADVQGRVFRSQPKSLDNACATRVVIYHGSPAWLMCAPSKIVLEIPEKAKSFSGYFGSPEESLPGEDRITSVQASIVVQERSGKSRVALERLLRPSSQAGLGRFSFRVPLDGARDRIVILTTGPDPAGGAEGGRSVWSRCRFDDIGSP